MGSCLKPGMIISCKVEGIDDKGLFSVERLKGDDIFLVDQESK